MAAAAAATVVAAAVAAISAAAVVDFRGPDAVAEGSRADRVRREWPAVVFRARVQAATVQVDMPVASGLAG